MKPIKTLTIALVVGLAAAVAAMANMADDYPQRPVTVIIPYGAGSNTDTSGRLLIHAMRQVIGADMVALNVPSASGTVGTAKLAASVHDGYTLGYIPKAAATIQPHLRPVPYNNTSFEPICMVTDNPTAVTVAPDSPYHSMEELIKARQNGKDIIAVGGAPGSMPHITQAMIANAYGVHFTYLPAGGGGRAAASILSGEATFATGASAMGRIHGLHTLAVAATERIDDLPDVPTLRELGHDVVSTVWYGLFAPAGTPASVLDTLSAACGKAVKTPAFVKGMANANYIVRYLDRAEFSDFFQSEYKRNRALLPVIGVKLSR